LTRKVGGHPVQFSKREHGNTLTGRGEYNSERQRKGISFLKAAHKGCIVDVRELTGKVAKNIWLKADGERVWEKKNLSV